MLYSKFVLVGLTFQWANCI